ncbi:four-carbon acid sugar kinase family protein [Sphingomonas psychrotolerans]|uniref:Hrp-dependent type III effector protein n=1 Tax=Sphingomonas psychrotolerans TaxID=1327635 RepID=A0A2K8MFN2_9SPHN|nr:four-carbon acid sugar kinase family protein [Sphingomonas psychrotolerans]ATY32702.1 Hrp-dependent type III effector protein [Sphingomonas psychrotolerans]
MTLLYAFYGDDFTGSTDVLEQLAEGGVPAVLFLRHPDAELRARFSQARAIGIAGDSRSRSPEWMSAHLPTAFAALSDAGLVHYKTCSTFDSSPRTGSIGRAIDIGRASVGGTAAIVVGAPHLRRYVAFGNLFAAAGAETYRIDRHPTMSRHPVTPMREADLIRHLAHQTTARIALVPLDRIQTGEAEAAWREVAGEADAVLFDGVSMADLAATGAVLRTHRVRFAAGSSGVTRALVLAWRDAGLIDAAAPAVRAPASERLLVVSGSCSPVTARQIARSAANGYFALEADVPALLHGDAAAEMRLVDTACAALAEGGRCVIYSAQGPLGEDATAAGDRLGAALGRITAAAIRRTGLRRLLFAGGDTSSHGVAELGIDALTWAAPIEPGAPLVRAHAADPAVDGLELVLKGGQIGGEDFFETVRLGG